MNILKLAAVLAVGSLVPTAAFATSTCSPLSGSLGSAYSTTVATLGTCNTLITLNNNGTATVATPNGNPYDGNEDNYVGVINNSGHSVSFLTLSGNDIFGFEGDGIDAYGIAGNILDNSGYGGGNAYYTPVDNSNGTVNFINAIGNGGFSQFSLEEAPSVLGFTVGTVGGATPEPSSLILLGTGALGIAGSFRRRIFNA